TSMTDGLGSVTYSYDSLSRMESETRYFGPQPGANNPALPGTYTLRYQYNLAGQGKRVGYESSAFPSDHSYIDYSYDKAGRMTSLTGSPFAGISNYATGMKYTAWGEVKSFTYGNNFTFEAAYNNRQQLQSLAQKNPNGTPVINKAYQYYPDGKIKFSDDLINP